MNMNYNAADYLMDNYGDYGGGMDAPSINQTPGRITPQTNNTNSQPKKRRPTGGVNQRRTPSGSGFDQDNYGSDGKLDLEGQGQMYGGQGSPMSDPLKEDPEGYGGYGTPTTGMPEYHPERGPFPQTPMGGPSFDPSPPINPPMDVPHYLPPFPPMNFPPFPPMPPQLPEINFEPMEMPERKPYGFASVDSRAAGYSENLPGAGTLRDKVLDTVGRSPLQNALQ